VRNFVAYPKGGNEVEDDREKYVEGNIWIYEGGNNMRLEKVQNQELRNVYSYILLGLSHQRG
jgi:hypothetical protein